MTVTKRIVCLANSRKLGGRCVAGIELAGDRRVRWIRPVSDRESQELQSWECQCDDGRGVSPLDVVEVPLLRRQPADERQSYQTENWLLKPGAAWRRVGRLGWGDLKEMVDPVGPLWADGWHTKNGRNDRIPLWKANSLTSSLRLIHVPCLTLRLGGEDDWYSDGGPRLQACFKYAGVEYRLRVTDPIYENRFRAEPEGDHPLAESLLTISIGEPFHYYCYKLVAAILERTSEEPED